MKRKLIIFRFGSDNPTQKERTIMHQITDGTQEAIGCSSKFGVISIVRTSMKPAEVVALFNKVAKEHDDVLPTIVFEEGENAAFHFDKFFFEQFEECNLEFDREFGTASKGCTLNLEEMLDLVKRKGLSNLTTVELARLIEVSK